MSALPFERLDDTSRGAENDIFAALARGDWAAAMRVAEAHLPSLLSHAPGTLHAACDAIPEDRLDTVPRWAALRTYVAHLLSYPRKSPLYPEAGMTIPLELSAADRVAVVTGQIAALRTLGHVTRAADLVDSAAATLRALQPRERAPLQPHLAVLLVQWGETLVFAGRIPDATATLDAAWNEALRAGNARAAIEAAADLAVLHALVGRGAEADAALLRHDELRARYPHIKGVRDGARLARAQRALDRLDLAGGLALFEHPHGFEELGLIAAGARAMARARARLSHPLTVRAELEVAVASVPGQRARQGLNAAMLAIARGTLPALGGMHEAALLALDARPTLPAVAEGLVSMRKASALLALGETERALGEAARGAQSPLPRVRIESLAVRAAALHRGGNEASAIAAFQEAIETAVANGLHAPLANLPASDLVILSAAVGSDALGGIIEHGSLLFPEAPFGYRRLTAQQLATLRVLVQTDTVEQAAERLGVSLPTAKSHLHEIYARFGVTDRAAALAEGRRRGLI